VGNQQSIVKYVSTEAGSSSGSSSGPNEIVLVASQEARKEQQQDEDAIMGIKDATLLSPPKVTGATSEEVLNAPSSEQQQESPSSIPTSAQNLKKVGYVTPVTLLRKVPTKARVFYIVNFPSRESAKIV
jgi:hypothetical protein